MNFYRLYPNQPPIKIDLDDFSSSEKEVLSELGFLVSFDESSPPSSVTLRWCIVDIDRNYDPRDDEGFHKVCGKSITDMKNEVISILREEKLDNIL